MRKRYQFGAVVLALALSGCGVLRAAKCIGSLGTHGCGKVPMAPASPSPSPEVAK